MTNIIVLISLIIIFPAIFLGSIRNPVWGLSILIFSMPILSQAQRLFLNNQTPYLSMETIAVIVLWISVQLHKRSKKRIVKKGIILTVAFFIFLLAGFISAYLARNSEIAYKILFVGGVTPLLCFSIASRYVLNNNDKRLVILGYFGLVIQTLIFTLLAFNVRQSLAPSDVDLINWLYSNQNAVIAFGSPSATISVIVAAIPLAAWYRIYGRWNNDLIWAVVSASTLGVAIMSLSRGSWVGILTALILSLPFYFKRIRGITVFVMIAMLLGLYFFGTFDFLLQAIDVRFGSPINTTNIRLANYQLALISSKNHVLWGLGLGNYSDVYREFPFANASNMEPLWFAHSLFITLIPEIGIFGTLAFVYIFLSQLRNGFRLFLNLSSNSDRWLMYSLSASIISYIVIVSTSGAHLVATLSDYLIAPAMIIIFMILGMISAVANCQIKRKVTIHQQC